MSCLDMLFILCCFIRSRNGRLKLRFNFQHTRTPMRAHASSNSFIRDCLCFEDISTAIQIILNGFYWALSTLITHHATVWPITFGCFCVVAWQGCLSTSCVHRDEMQSCFFPNSIKAAFECARQMSITLHLMHFSETFLSRVIHISHTLQVRCQLKAAFLSALCISELSLRPGIDAS